MRTEKVLAEKVALVTGGASGIGRAIAASFAGAGAAVMIIDIDAASAEAAVRAITGKGGRAVFVAGDVSRAEDCQHAVEKTVGVLGALDILVNSAGMIRRASVTETTEAEWDRVMAVNVKSIFLLSSLAIPVMAGAGGGVIINLASGWGLAGGPRAAAYCASKGAVVLLTKAMAIDHGPQNIRVNCICPGTVDTPSLDERIQAFADPVQARKDFVARQPMGRLATAEELAEAFVFLVSDESSFMTGQALFVDGGMSL